MIVNADGFVEAFGYHGARVLVTERWADQTEAEWERTLGGAWRRLWQTVDGVRKDIGFPKGNASWKQRNGQLVQLDTLMELARSVGKGRWNDRVRELAAVFETDEETLRWAAKLLQLEESTARTDAPARS